MTGARICLDDRVRLSEELVFREVDGEAVILNLASGIYFGLNEVGTRIWNLMQEEGSLRAVFDAMRKQYEVAPAELAADLLRLVEEMREKGLVRVSTPAKCGS